jgi:hypothetical protein
MLKASGGWGTIVAIRRDRFCGAMKCFQSVLILEKRRLVCQLKELTQSKTIEALAASIQIWQHYYEETMVKGKVLQDQNLSDKAYKALRLKGGITSRIRLFASLRKFHWLHGQMRYLDLMFKAHEAGLPLIPEYTPGAKPTIPEGFGVSKILNPANVVKG